MGILIDKGAKMRTYHLIFKGRVQGVGFRYTAKMIADKLKIYGSVKNLYNGDVEVYIKGDDESIDRFIRELRDQRFINIESIEKDEVSKDMGKSSFDILY